MSNIPSSRKRQGPQSATAGRVHGALRPDVDVELGWESVTNLECRPSGIHAKLPEDE